MEINPDTIAVTPGKLLVQIVEVLGGTRKSGLFVPGESQDHMGKDTFYGKILKIGDPPMLEHYCNAQYGAAYDVRENRTGKTWCAKAMAQFSEGDILILPRDVPLAFVWEEVRYALVLMHEGLFSMDPATFDPTDFEVVPWQPN